jgi:hypothetical protein
LDADNDKRRLTFYLSREEASTDERLALECMELILKDIFKGLAFAWERYLNCCSTHVSILEDKIYDSPADESRAPELWTTSSLWLKLEKLMYIHIEIVREMRSHLEEMTGLEEDEIKKWFETTLDEFEKLSNVIQEDLVKPTTSLSDLVCKHLSKKLGNTKSLTWLRCINQWKYAIRGIPCSWAHRCGDCRGSLLFFCH